MAPKSKLVRGGYAEFVKQVDELLEQGWHVVPGTVAGASAQAGSGGAAFFVAVMQEGADAFQRRLNLPDAG